MMMIIIIMLLILLNFDMAKTIHSNNDARMEG
jgi:hypothetical protein